MKAIKSVLEKFPIEAFLLLSIVLLIPIEHKYDKVLRPFIYAHTDWPRPIVRGFYFYISDLLILLLGLSCLLRKKYDFAWAKNSKYLLLLILFCFYSLLWSPLPINVIHWTKAFYCALTLLFGASISLFMQGERFLKLFFWSVVFLALFECFVGIAQYTLQGPLGLKVLGEPKVFNCYIGSLDGKRWFFDQSNSYPSLLRVYGTFPHPNVFGGFLVLSLLCSYGLFFLYSRQRIFLALAICIQILTLYITYSRSALFAWIGSTILWFFLMGLKKNRNLLIVFMIGGLACFSLLYKQFASRGGIVNYNQTSKSSDLTRIVAQGTAWELIKKYPLTGVGFSNAGQGNLLLGKPCPAIHNIYLLVAVEMGIFALGFFLLFICTTLQRGFRNRNDPYVITLLAIFVGFLFIGCCDYYLFSFQQGKLFFFLVGGLLSRPAELNRVAAVECQPSL